MDTYGTLRIVRNWDPVDGRHTTRIVRADPRVRVSREVLDDLRYGAVGEQLIDGRDPHFQLVGDVLSVSDDFGHQFIYRLDFADDDGRTIHAEWPD